MEIDIFYNFIIHICLERNKSNNEEILLWGSHFQFLKRVLGSDFVGVPGPTFKLWGGPTVLEPEVPRSRVAGSLSHFYTMWKSVKILNIFNTLTLKQIFSKTKTCFKTLEYRFLVESTKIQNAPFPYKTAISEANVKANRMVTTKWAYHRERSFASNCFIFLEFFFQFKSLLQRVDLLYQQPKCPYLYFL